METERSYLLVLFGTIILVAVLIGQSFLFYSSAIYPADQAQEWVWRARATNNLGDMAMYLEKAENGLEAYRGNPAWIFPKPDTDWDFIKTNIHETRTTAENIVSEETIGSYGYQQAVHNLQETTVEIAEHMGIAAGCIWINPMINVCGSFIFALLIALWIFGLIVWFRS